MKLQARHARILVLVSFLSLLFPSIAIAGAPKPPPDIGDIEGVWFYSGKDAFYNFGIRKPLRDTWQMTGDITAAGPNEVWMWADRAHYFNGILLAGWCTSAGDLPAEASLSYCLIAGTPGKLKMTWQEFWYSLIDQQMGTWTGIGKQLSSNASAPPLAPASRSNIALNRPVAPPSIDDLDSAAFNLDANGVMFDLLTGGKESYRDLIRWTITKTGADSLIVHDDLRDFTAYYNHGALIIGFLNDNAFPTNAYLIYVAVSGVPGSLALKGEGILFDTASTHSARVLKFTGKQVSD
jgi:hypothetical protein